MKSIVRSCLMSYVMIGLSFFSAKVMAQLSPKAAIQQANHELWSKFIDKYGVVNDFVGERPTPEDCRLSRPNAFGWWTPIEDGAFFTGLYLAAACDRAKATGDALDRDKARILAQGLLKLSMVSDVPGFIARGVSTDGRTHYPNGSNDQTIPWVYGLHMYLRSGIPSAREQQIIQKKMIEVIIALKLAKWRFPSDGTYTGLFRDDLLDDRFLEVPCYLYLLRVMYDLTKENDWLVAYNKAVREKPHGAVKTRAQICEEGIRYDLKMWGEGQSYLWIYVMKQAALVELANWEQDAVIKTNYITGIKNNREFVQVSARKYNEFDNHDPKVFGNAAWRACYTDWYPQYSIEDAIAVSKLTNGEKVGKRKGYERNQMTTPLAAASIIALAGNKSDCELIQKIIAHYDYSVLYLSEFFYAEYAYYKVECR